MNTVRALAATDRSLDLSRVGIYGGSAGGQNTLNALLFHPDFYKAGIAYAGCFDNRMDKIDWNEQWLGWPVDQSYLDASGVVHAAKLRGQLLLVVGEQDSNVDPASTMQVVDALIRADRQFELLVIPRRRTWRGAQQRPGALRHEAALRLLPAHLARRGRGELERPLTPMARQRVASVTTVGAPSSGIVQPPRSARPRSGV